MSLATTLPTASETLRSFLAGPAINSDPVLTDLLVCADAVENATLIIFDFFKQKTLHAGEGISGLSGYPVATACDGGAAFVLKITNPEELTYLMLLQSGYVREAKEPEFDPRSLRFHDYYWSIIRKDGNKTPVASTGIVLTYTKQSDLGIGVGFHIRNDEDCDARLIKCKELLRLVKLRHNQVYHQEKCERTDIAGPYRLHHVIPDTDLITQRERQVLGMLAQGHSTVAIAEALNIAANTVESHRKKLLQKFRAKNTAQLILRASKVFWLT